MKVIDLLSKLFKDRSFNKKTNFNLNFLHAMYAIFSFINK